MRRKKIAALLFLSMTALATMHAQDIKIVPRDTIGLPLRVGYAHVNADAQTGAVDQVTEKSMNKHLVTSSLEALAGQKSWLLTVFSILTHKKT